MDWVSIPEAPLKATGGGASVAPQGFSSGHLAARRRKPRGRATARWFDEKGPRTPQGQDIDEVVRGRF